MSSSPPNSPASQEAKYRGAPRPAAGYSYWATSPEDDEAPERIPGVQIESAPNPEPSQPRGAGLRRGLKGMTRLAGKALLFGALAVLLYVAFTAIQVYRAADNDETRIADAIVVLGAAQFDGTPSPVFASRLDHAFLLYSGGQARRIITTGANQEGDRLTEGLSGYLYLRDKGVPDADLVTIVDGTNTWEQLSAASFQIEELDLANVLLVSDGYHNYRLQDMADEVGITAYVSPTGADASFMNYARETAAVSLGRIFGYRRLSSLTTQ